MKKIFRFFLSFNPVSISTLIIIIVLVMLGYGIEIFHLFELKTYDQRLKWRGERPISGLVVAVVIDEKSLDKEGMWPWSRHKMATLINRLSDDGAKVIGMDIFFTEPDKSISMEIINYIEKRLNALNITDDDLFSYLDETKRLSDNDMLFADAIKSSKAKVVMPYFWHSSQKSLGYDIGLEELDRRLKIIGNSLYSMMDYDEALNDDYDPFFNPYINPYAPEVNLEILSVPASGSGYIDLPYEDDGIIRRMPLAVKYGDRDDVYTPFSLQCAWQYLDSPPLILQITKYYGIDGVRIGRLFVPTDEKGGVLINYYGPGGTIPHYSATDIIQGNFETGTFRDKIVVVGSTAQGAHDMRNTPFDSAQPGLEVHATVIENIINQDFIKKTMTVPEYDYLAVIILGLIIAFIIPRAGAIMGLTSTALVIILYTYLCMWLFSNYGLWVNMVYPIMGVMLLYASLTSWHFLVEEKNKRFLHSTFSSYLSPELIDDMVTSKTIPILGGEARVVTAYFTDIENFSLFSERLTAPQLVDLLNEYLSSMTDILLKEKGTLDKYEGDAIIAFLGAPMSIPDHTLRACRAAIEMQNRLVDLRKKWGTEKQMEGEPDRNIKRVPSEIWNPGDKWPKVVHEMRMRIGINSGEIVIGNMGSKMRMNYTMMGDAVNLAARLEAGAKQYGIYTAVSEHTLNMEYINEKGENDRAINHVEARFIDNIIVVGRSEPVKIFELFAMKGGLTGHEKELFNLFDQGINNYLDMQWKRAIECFRESLKFERYPDAKTNPSEVYIKRCEEYLDNPPAAPGEIWDGVYRLTEK
ncbi:MAG: adenylate/guanylate cyclase domain-containing protein [Desulfatiglans sp.]|jgi:adenylate cyclase|nr:adenylate/guanylate cyclase domain-containing protein [Desulfatiglans sp.]